MKFLITGLGSIGRRHLRHLVLHGEHEVVLYRTNLATLPDDELAEYPVETDLDKALAQKPDAVIVSNPTALHLAVALPAAKAGCHILLEKPVSHSLEGLDELQRVVDAQGVGVLVGFQFRYHPGLRKAVELLKEETVGRALSFRIHWGEYLPDWHPWEDYRQSYAAREDLGGGVILTLTHPLDYARWLFGEVTQLSAFAENSGELDIEVEDTAEINLQFESGVIGSIHLDYNQRPPRHEMEIVCTEGTMRWDHAGDLRVYSAVTKEWVDYSAPADYERDHLFRDQMAHFLEVAAGRAEPVCTLGDGIRAVEMALAAKMSSEKKEVIGMAEFSKGVG